MKDFIGNEIQPGAFLAKGGGGNGSGSYGMVAYRVLAIKNRKLSVERLVISYPGGNPPGVVAVQRTTISNSNAVILFDPSPNIVQLFTDAKVGTLSVEDREFIGIWLHGPEHAQPWGE